ncbi:MAG: hypothetical protein QGG42_08805 [Phycisphaerae bacterium]|nr:hypothetical protein [Phycisphaerae bacterium]
MKHKKTFRSLTDVLMLLTLLSIPAVMVIPRHDGALPHSERSAEISNVQTDRATNLQRIRAQLELYRLPVKGSYPTDINTQLTSKTDPDGATNTSSAYGPYLHQFPANPFVDDSVKAVKTSGKSGEEGSYGNTAGHKGL